MPKQSGLDGRHRDNDGEIHRKMGNTRIESLRKTYGEDFARGWRSDKKLENSTRRYGRKISDRFSKEPRKVTNKFCAYGLHPVWLTPA